MYPVERVVKQMMDERQREAERDALARKHSRAGLLRRFLQTIARREGR